MAIAAWSRPRKRHWPPLSPGPSIVGLRRGDWCLALACDGKIAVLGKTISGTHPVRRTRCYGCGFVASAIALARSPSKYGFPILGRSVPPFGISA